MINHENTRVVARTGTALRTEVTANAHALVARSPNSTDDRVRSLGALLARFGPQEGKQQTLRHKEEHS